MLDENLPSFQFRASSDNPLTSVLHFTQNGSDPAPEYVFKRADPVSQPEARNNYAVALTDPYSQTVVYGEVLVCPEWQQPTLSAAEIRASAQNGIAAPPVPLVPDAFSIQLYNPDQTISFRMITGGWGKSDTWEFEMPSQSFRQPSASQLDRQQDAPPISELTPKVMFRWKKDGRLSKDMTCYMGGRSVGRHKSKEPDITVALFKQGRESCVTIYEPNMQRVDVEDRKGLEVVLLLGAEVIRDLYLAPRPDVFNIISAAAGSSGSSSSPAANGKPRKNSRPPVPPSVPIAAHPPPASSSSSSSAAAAAVPPGAMMSGALGPAAAGGQKASLATRPAAAPEIDAETLRLKAMLEREERERLAQAERERKEREARDKAEQKRIKRMLEQEEEEQRRRDAEIAKETERLRKMYGVEGQDLPSARPALPPRPPGQGQGQGQGQGPGQGRARGQGHVQPAVTFAPAPGLVPGPSFTVLPSQGGWFGRPNPPARPVSAGPPPHHAPPTGSGPYLTGPFGQNPSASSSGFFHRDRRDSDSRKKMQKKRSVHF